MAPPPPAGTPRPAPRSRSSGLAPSCCWRRPGLATPLLRPRSPPAPIGLPGRSALTAAHATPTRPPLCAARPAWPLAAGASARPARLLAPRFDSLPDSAPMVAARAAAASAKQVTRQNFAEAVRELENHLKACDYVTVAALKTGTPTGWLRALPVDTPETAYLKAKLAAESFQPLHITVCPFHLHATLCTLEQMVRLFSYFGRAIGGGASASVLWAAPVSDFQILVLNGLILVLMLTLLPL